MARKPKPDPTAATRLEPSDLVPRRIVGSVGRKPPKYPELNFQVVGPAIGISPTYVGRILNGISRPSMQVAEKLSAYMGWTLDQVNGLYKPKVTKSKSKKLYKPNPLVV